MDQLKAGRDRHRTGQRAQQADFVGRTCYKLSRINVSPFNLVIEFVLINNNLTPKFFLTNYFVNLMLTTFPGRRKAALGLVSSNEPIAAIG